MDWVSVDDPDLAVLYALIRHPLGKLRYFNLHNVSLLIILSKIGSTISHEIGGLLDRCRSTKRTQPDAPNIGAIR
eukprot:1342076-Ditylum_brightwellii.AAC.1